MVRKLYSAMLLICDPETGKVGSFYSSEGELLSREATGESVIFRR